MKRHLHHENVVAFAQGGSRWLEYDVDPNPVFLDPDYLMVQRSTSLTEVYFLLSSYPPRTACNGWFHELGGSGHLLAAALAPRPLGVVDVGGLGVELHHVLSDEGFSLALDLQLLLCSTRSG